MCHTAFLMLSEHYEPPQRPVMEDQLKGFCVCTAQGTSSPLGEVMQGFSLSRRDQSGGGPVRAGPLFLLPTFSSCHVTLQCP